MICNHPNGFSDAFLRWKMWTTFQPPNFWMNFQPPKNWTKFLSEIFGTKIRSEILNEKRQSKNQSKICPKFFSSKSFCFFFGRILDGVLDDSKKSRETNFGRPENKNWTEFLDGPWDYKLDGFWHPILKMFLCLEFCKGGPKILDKFLSGRFR